MSGLADREILDAVAAVEDEMLDLLARLVEAPTTVGNEEAGQAVMEEAFRELCGLDPFDVATDAEALRAHPSAVGARVEEAVARAGVANAYLAEHPPAIRYSGFPNDGTHYRDDEPIEAVASAWEAATGEPAVTGPTTATTEVRAFAAVAVSAACIGPLAERIHGVDERVYVPSVVQTAQVLALIVRDWCGLA